MGPPASTHAMALVLLASALMAPEATALAHGHKQQHHQQHSAHQQHHNTHMGGYHGPRAARTRREQGDQPHPDIGTITCTVEGNECLEVTNSECNKATLQCYCPTSFPIHDYENRYCVKEAKLNATCQFTSQCEESDPFSQCKSSLCVCKDGYLMDDYPNVGLNCVDDGSSNSKVDPAMMGVLVGLALMFVIICVVLRLFSKARFRENRSIFNTPNPRLMNASLFKDIGVSGRRGSAMSAVSATGSAAGVAASGAKTPSPTKKEAETTVAIETVD